jgi:uncharacterized protein YuzE
MMQIRYDPEADVLVWVLNDSPSIEATAEPGGLIVSYGEDGEVVTIEWLNASRKIDLNHRR